MNLGRLQTAAICLACIAFSVSGCGDKASTSSTAGASADTGSAPSDATGATGKTKKAKAKAKKKSSKSSSDSGTSKGQPVTTYNNPTVETTSPDQLVPPPGQKAAVRDVFNRNVDAIRKGDVSELCNNIYSQGFLDMLDQRGGCQTVTSKQIEGITSYSSKVSAISRYPNSNLIVVYASFKFTNATGDHKSKGGLYFKTEGKQWKRAVPAK